MQKSVGVRRCRLVPALRPETSTVKNVEICVCVSSRPYFKGRNEHGEKRGNCVRSARAHDTVVFYSDRGARGRETLVFTVSGALGGKKPSYFTDARGAREPLVFFAVPGAPGGAKS